MLEQNVSGNVVQVIVTEFATFRVIHAPMSSMKIFAREAFMQIQTFFLFSTTF